MRPDRNPARSISARGLGLLPASILGYGAQCSPGPSRDPSWRRSRREPAQGGDRGGAGAQRTYLEQPALAGPRVPPARARSSTANPPFWCARAAGRTPAPARARCLLLLGAEPRAVGEARGVGPATGARRRGEGAVACSSSVPGSGPSPSRRRRRCRLLSSLRRRTPLSRWERSQRSVSGASG